MKITYLHQYFNTPDMSGGTRSYEMARRLVAMGHEVNLITSSREADAKGGWRVSQEAGITVYWLPVSYSNEMSYARRTIAFLKFAFCSGKKAATIDADIIFATSTPLTIVFPAVYSSRILKKPMVFEVRDLWPELPIAMGALKNPVLKKFARWMESWAYRNSESVVALSPGMKKGVVDAGYVKDRIAVIPNSSDNNDFEIVVGSDIEFRMARPWLLRRPLILYPGTLGKINGVGYLVKLAKAMLSINPEIRFLILGNGSEQASIRALAESLGVFEKNLFMENSVPKNQMYPIFSAADFICSLFIDLPEMRANSANKFFDSLASSKAVLLNYGGWQADLVKDAGCGIVTWQLEIEDAALLINRRLADPVWLAKVAAKSKDLAVRFFDRDKLASELEMVLKNAVVRRGENAEHIAPGNYGR